MLSRHLFIVLVVALQYSHLALASEDLPDIDFLLYLAQYHTQNGDIIDPTDFQHAELANAYSHNTSAPAKTTQPIKETNHEQPRNTNM